MQTHPNRAHSTIVCLHMPLTAADSNVAEWLNAHPEVTVTVMTELHREKLGQPVQRLITVPSGIPVPAHDWRYQSLGSASPGLKHALRKARCPDEVFNHGARLLSQVDRISPNKSQLLTAWMFRESGLWRRGYHVLLAGGHEDGPKSTDPGRPEMRVEYWHALCKFVASDPLLREHIHFLPALNGGEVQELMRASSAFVAPYGLRHADASRNFHGLDPAEDWWEPLGLAPLHASACGVPITLSDHVSEESILEGVTGWRVGCARDGARILAQKVARVDPTDNVHRERIHEWVLERHDLAEGGRRYAQLISNVLSRLGIHFSPDLRALEQASLAVSAYEGILAKTATRLVAGASETWVGDPHSIGLGFSV